MIQIRGVLCQIFVDCIQIEVKTVVASCRLYIRIFSAHKNVNLTLLSRPTYCHSEFHLVVKQTNKQTMLVRQSTPFRV